MEAPLKQTVLALFLVMSACGGSTTDTSVDVTADADDWVAADRVADEVRPDLADSVDLIDPVDLADSVDLTDSVDLADSVDLTDSVDLADSADLVDSASTVDSVELVDSVDVQPDIQPDVPEPPPVLFDLGMISDPTSAACSFTDHHVVLKGTTLVDAWKVSYYSWESIDGELQPILIKAFAARPVGLSNAPGVVQAHGLGGFATEDHATGTAALLNMFVLANTGPGGGDSPNNTSEGLGADHEDGYRLFDTLEDARGSWFWGHAVAAMRGLTCLENHPDVDPERLGMVGYSAGAVATLISSSVDDIIKAAVPVGGTLAWDVAVESPKAWQNNLLALAGLDYTAPEWVKLMDEIVSADALLPGNQSKVLMVNGSTDEFFPLTAHMACFDTLADPDKRTSIAANFDHGCYALTGIENAGDIEERALIRTEGGQRMWLRHWFGTDDNYQYVPAPPQIQVEPLGAISMVTALVDGGGGKLDVENVKLWWSNDDSFFYVSAELDDNGNGLYSLLAPMTVQANTVYFVDVQYKTKSLLFPERFSITSPPIVPADLIPQIRDMTSCL